MEAGILELPFSLESNMFVKAPAATLTAAMLLGATLFGASGAWAEIRFEDRGERFSLDVRDEPIADVIDALAERFDLVIDGYPEHWSKDPMNFSATGDLERVLKALLKDTSHVFEYHTDLDTRETRIASLKLLNEGVDGFVASGPSTLGAQGPNGQAPNTERPKGQRVPGTLADRANPDRLEQGDFATGAQDLQQPVAATTPPVAGTVSGLSQSLEARARQSSGTTSSAAGLPRQTTGQTTAPQPGVPSEEMRALTQKALQDVKGLADALKAAEGK